MQTIKEVIEDLFNPKLSINEAMDRHFTPAFRQRVNGNWIDRGTFLNSIVGIREALDVAKITVLDEVTSQEKYAERHIIDLVMRDGTRVCKEVYLFAQRDSEGRFVRIEEAIISLGDESQST